MLTGPKNRRERLEVFWLTHSTFPQTPGLSKNLNTKIYNANRCGYMHVRRQILSGGAVKKRTENLIRHRLSELAARPEFLNQGVTTVTNHIKTNSSNNGGMGYQKEFNKARRKIQTLLQAGKSRKDVHERLTESGRLTMSYGRFCGFVVKEIDKDPLFLSPPAKAGSRRREVPPARRASKR